ncbi:MAG: glycosyltransferase family 2 protein [Vicinamibacteria bacterium]|nr:glycosyltransferase family 2 protein [Vicinamibacteria bacterium]
MISAVVPTRGGDSRLARHLPSVVAALVSSGDTWEIIVVDDGDTLKATPVNARVLPLSVSRGYGPAVNAGVAAARGDLLLVLNDDVSLEETAVRRLLEALPSDGVFAVAPRIVSPLARCGDEGGKAGAFRAGLLEIEEAPASETHPTLYSVGCCYLCRKTTFLALGGYDDVYAPFYWEDVDLGYRAWQRGLASLHVPSAVCHHEGSATIGERSMDERLRVWHRNWALFHLRNVRDRRERAACLGAWVAYALFEDRPAVLGGLVQAIEGFVPLAGTPAAARSDGEILRLVMAR